MKFFDITNEGDFLKIRELAPTVAPGTPGAPLGAAPAAGPAAGPAPGATAATQDPQAAAKMQAQQALDRANQKKEIQAQITATQKQLQELQKQLAAIK